MPTAIEFLAQLIHHVQTIYDNSGA